MPFQATIVTLLVGLAMVSVGTKDYRVSKVQPLGEIRCNFHMRDLLDQALNRASISNHQRRTIRFIVATEVEKDYHVPNWSIKKGQYFCVAAETTDDLAEGQAHRVWLFIPRFIPAQ